MQDIRQQTRWQFSAEDKISIMLDGLRGEDSMAERCRKEGTAQSLYYTWSKEFMEAGKRRLSNVTPADAYFSAEYPPSSISVKGSSDRRSRIRACNTASLPPNIKPQTRSALR